MIKDPENVEPKEGLRIYFQNVMQQPGLPVAVDLEKQIGSGTYGRVFEVKDINSDARYAIKAMKITETRGLGSLMDISVSCTVDAPGLTSARDIVIYKQWIYVLLDLATMDLFNYLYLRKLPLETQNIKKWFYQLIYAMLSLNHAGTIHGDLKPNNLLYFEQTKEVKICDFTLCIRKDWLRLFRGTISSGHYRAPEVWFDHTAKQMNWDERVDVWSLGCIFFEMMYRKPFIHYQVREETGNFRLETKRMLNCFRDWAKWTDQSWDHASHDVSYTKPNLLRQARDKKNSNWRFLNRMLKLNYRHRANWKDLLRDPYLTGISLTNNYNIRSTFQENIPLKERQKLAQLLEPTLKNEIIRDFTIELYSRLIDLDQLRRDQKIAGCIFIATKLTTGIPVGVSNFKLHEIIHFEQVIADALSFSLHFSFRRIEAEN